MTPISPDPTLLFVGLVASLFWVALIIFGIHKRHIILPIAAACTTFNSVVFSFLNAHYHLPQFISDFAIVFRTPATAMLFVAYISMQYGWRFCFRGKPTLWFW